MITEELTILADSINGELAEIQKLLRQRLSDAPTELINDLSTIEAYNGRVLTLLAEANSLLDRATHDLRPVQGEGSETDRKVKMEASTADFRRLRDILEGLSNAIKQRLILGESFLAWNRQFADHGNNQSRLEHESLKSSGKVW